MSKTAANTLLRIQATVVILLVAGLLVLIGVSIAFPQNKPDQQLSDALRTILLLVVGYMFGAAMQHALLGARNDPPAPQPPSPSPAPEKGA